MEIVKDTLDDLLLETYNRLLNEPFIHESSRTDDLGPFSEVFGVLLELKNPRSRLSHSDTKGKLFTAIGELLWYLASSEDLAFISYYAHAYEKESFDKKTIYGAYGPRLFNSVNKYDQVENVLFLLKKGKGTSKRAVMQLFEARDISLNVPENEKSIPCTCSLQFLRRDDKLHMMTFMRSNDVFLGLPNDIFAFTMLQEYLAAASGLELGTYKHSVGSLHMYSSRKQDAENYINEGYQSTTIEMPVMPSGDQQDSIKTLLQLEEKIRKGEDYDIEGSNLDLYWKELAYLLGFYGVFKNEDVDDRLGLMLKIRSQISTKIYQNILDSKIQNFKKKK